MAEITSMSPSQEEHAPLTNPELITRLSELCQLDIDAVYAYEKAMAAIGEEDSDIRNAIGRFCEDHVEHVMNLSSVIWGLGGKPPTVSRDIKGFFIEGMTAVQSLLGTKGALKAMSLNESLTNKAYDAALAWEMPDGLRLLIEEHREDERRHKEYIDSVSAHWGENVTPEGQPQIGANSEQEETSEVEASISHS